ncbi:MAG: UbiA family prenyltransferase [Rhodomicrobium sp.]
MSSDVSIWPLVIDLDGTLIKTDSLDETFLDMLRANPLDIFKIPLKLIVGRAALKAFLAGKSELDVETWPVRGDFLDFVCKQFEGGRKVVLATAADRKIADAIAARFPFISEVIASDGTLNLKGSAKARRLCERFPEGFIYAGDSPSDIAIWQQSKGSVLVDASERVFRMARQVSEPLAVLARQRSILSVLHRSLRLHQWAKNALVFVPLVLGGKALESSAWIMAMLGFIALGLAASATYIVNDLWDLPSDRRHWSKRFRPLASGDLSIREGLLWSAACLAGGLGVAAVTGNGATIMLALYIAGTLSYSFGWKRVPILDVFVLAGLFTLRLGFGILLADVVISPWLLVFSMFVFGSLSMAKRHTEVLRLAERGLDCMPGRGYIQADAPLTLGVGLASMLGAILIMVLYLIEDAFPRGFYANPAFLWAVPPILFLFLSRIWLISQRGQLHDDPVAFALKDRLSLALGGMTVIAFAAAMFNPAGL